MSSPEIRKQLHGYIDLIDDDETLLLLNDAAAAYATKQPDILDLLTPQQQKRLKESISQADEGKTIPHQEVIKMSKEWLQRNTR